MATAVRPSPDTLSRHDQKAGATTYSQKAAARAAGRDQQLDKAPTHEQQALGARPAKATSTRGEQADLPPSSARPSSGDIITAIPEAPITLHRPVPKDLDQFVANPGLPRATQAADRTHPSGTPSAPTNRSVLQQHCAFWDRDGDMKVFPWDTFRGCRELGYNFLICCAFTLALHSLFIPWMTSDHWWLLDPRMPINLKNIHRVNHGSDSGTYDGEGRFIPQKFEEIFSKYEYEGKEGLSLKDIVRMLRGQANMLDFVGWAGALGEWLALWLIAADHHGVVHKADVRGCYDGSLFYRIAERRRREREGRSGGVEAGRPPQSGQPGGRGEHHSVNARVGDVTNAVGPRAHVE